MYTSENKISNKHLSKISFVYLIISAFSMAFGIIYEHFSHEVYSYYMIFAFCFPLIGGSLVFMILKLLRLPPPTRLSINLYNSGIATLTIGSIIKGILDIYGTTNSLVKIYWIIGSLFLISSIMAYLIRGVISIKK